MNQRPQDFRFNPQASLAKGLVFAGLGRHPKSKRYTDSSLYKNTGTLTNMDPATDWVWSPELNRWVLDFDGTDDYVGLGNILSFTQTQPFTVSCWIIPNVEFNSTIGRRDIFEKWTAWGVVYDWQNGQLTFYTGNGNKHVSVAQTLEVGAPYHIAGVRDGNGNAWLYLNGVEIGSIADDTATPSSSGQVTIASGNGRAYFAPMIGCDFMAHNRALTPGEIQALADPSNVMLSGLILPPRRRVWAVSAGPTFNPAWARNCNNLIGAGI